MKHLYGLDKSIIGTLLLLISGPICANVLLHQPQSISQGEVAAMSAQRDWQFYWKLNFFADCVFMREQQKDGFMVRVAKVPVYWHNCRVLPTLAEVKNALFANAYRPIHQLKGDGTTPKHIALEELAVFLSDKKYAFYTGAGISIAAGLPSGVQVEQSLCVDQGLMHFLRAIWHGPQKLAQAFTEFLQSLIVYEPTPAHYAIKSIAEKKDAAVLTQNLDFLHHKTGIYPIEMNPKTVASHIILEQVFSMPSDAWQSLDALICVGVGCDNRGLLAWYKKNNPQGVLVVLDQVVPQFLMSNDYVCLVDAQTALSWLVQKI